MNLIAEIRERVGKTCSKVWSDVEVEIDISTPPATKEKFGDYATPVALQIAKKLGLNPLEVATEIKSNLGKVDFIREVTVTPPGFVNFWIDFEALAKSLLKEDLKVATKKKQNVSIEHTSVNPNKAAHIGHLRNACLGDSLKRLFEHLGHRVEVQNYIDDLGLQVADSVVAYRKYRDDESLGEIQDDEWFWKAYARIQQDYEGNPELLKEREEILHEMEAGESQDAKSIVEKMVTAHRSTFEKFGITYDLEVYEHDIVDNHLWDELFKELQSKELIQKPSEGDHAGAWVVPYGDTERDDKILVRSNGILTYTAKDLAYTLWKFGRANEMKGYKRLLPIHMHVNVIDERQSYPQAVIKHVLRGLGYQQEADNYLHLAYGVVKLSAKAMKLLGKEVEENKAYSMSGRSGIGVMVKDLLRLMKETLAQNQKEEGAVDQVAIGAIRYYMQKSRPDREIVFDFEDALKTDGNTGVYIQYAYARAKSILEKAGKAKDGSVTPNEYEEALLKQISELEEALQQAAQELDPSLICDYTYSLANSFAKFYETSPVLTVEDELKSFRIKLIGKYLETMGVCLEILGIPALSKI